ncbi:hypothetical protein AOQ84DRAFT_436531, partial [Glonium stellatum]
MQLPAHPSRRSPTFINHTPRTFEMATTTTSQDPLDPSSHSLSRACTQTTSRGSLELSPFSSFDQHYSSTFHSASFADRSTPPSAYYSDSDTRRHRRRRAVHPPSTFTFTSTSTGPSHSHSYGSNGSQQYFAAVPGLSLSPPTAADDADDAAPATFPVQPTPYSWASSDSSDFECAVAGEYSPYTHDFPSNPSNHSSDPSSPFATTAAAELSDVRLAMRAPPVL